MWVSKPSVSKSTVSMSPVRSRSISSVETAPPSSRTRPKVTRFVMVSMWRSKRKPSASMESKTSGSYCWNCSTPARNGNGSQSAKSGTTVYVMPFSTEMPPSFCGNVQSLPSSDATVTGFPSSPICTSHTKLRVPPPMHSLVSFREVDDAWTVRERCVRRPAAEAAPIW